MKKSKFAIKVASTIARHQMMCGKSRVLVCISGGADSVSLLKVLMTLGYDCVAAHCNFGLRGAESDADEAFVEKLCRDLGVGLVKTRFDVESYINSHKGLSVEMACRELRYEWFAKEAKEHGCQYIAVGHNINDREETFVLNMLRGTGVRGLASIKYVNGNIVRPLLDVTREEIEEYLKEEGLCYRTDSTNFGNDYERNKVRNLLLPYMCELFPDNAFRRTVVNLSEAGEFYEQALDGVAAQLVKENLELGTVELEISKFKEMRGGRTALHEMMQRYGFNATQVDETWNSEHGTVFLSDKYRAENNRSILLISKIDNSSVQEIFSFVIEEQGIEGDMPIGLQVKREKFEKGYKFERSGHTLYLSKEIIGKPLLMRHWKQGDVIYPYGMKGKKRLVSDLMSDAKKSPVEKRAIWILESEGKILWVVGLRASQYYSVVEGDDMVLITMPSL